MDFEPTYTPEQEEFRQEVREWLKENVSPDISHPPDSINITEEQYQLRRALGRKLGEKGWLWATAPEEYGGGGLALDHAVVIEEEVDSYGLTVPPYYDSGGRLGGASIMVWGTEEQKQTFLPPIFRGEVRTWQLLTEPEAGSDLANAKMSAERDGDEYVINGQKIYVGSSLGADYMWTITCTDNEAPRHQNLGWFMIPADLPGITIQPMDLLISGGEAGAGSGVKNTVFFDNVRVPAFNLIGGENEGWKVATTHLELEHGTGGRIARNWLVDHLFEYCRENKRNGQPLTKDPEVRDKLIDIYVEAARSIGASDLRISIRHVLPNVFAPVIIIATAWVGNAIVIEAALSFLGMGTPPPTPTWGGMLAGEGQRNLENAPWLAIFPGLAISIVVLSFNMLGDALRDVLDPRLRSR